MKGLSFALCYDCACEDDDVHNRRDRVVHVAGASPLAPPASMPKLRGFPTYSSAPEQPLLGVPIVEKGLWHLSSHERFEPVTFSLYVNGFTFSTPDNLEASVSLSPFSLVRNCRFQSEECSKLKSFKISHMDHEPASYFAVRSLHEREAEVERSNWVLGISHTILLITDSILPPFSVTCDPIPGLPRTARRLLAGYLVHRDDTSTVSVLYCELSAHTSVCSQLVLYENELCQVPVHEIVISESSVCSDVIGINCTCFVVNSHHFASQTPSERKLWLRAISNVKVKLQNCAPDPTEEELLHYRNAIREHIQAIEATLEPTLNSEALLTRCAYKGIAHSLSGDDEPVSEVPSEYDSKKTGGNIQTALL